MSLSQKDAAVDKDFILIVSSADIGQPEAIVETHPTLGNNRRAILLSLVPKYHVPRIFPDIILIPYRRFKIPHLRNVLTRFLKSLPGGMKFNICSYDHSLGFLWPESKPNNKKLDIALKYVHTISRDDYFLRRTFRPLNYALTRNYKLLQVEIIFLSFEEKLRNLFYIFWGENVLVLISECSLSGSATMYHTIWSSTWPGLAEGMRSLSEVTTSSMWKWSRCSRLRSGYTSGSKNLVFCSWLQRELCTSSRRLMKPHCSRMSCPWRSSTVRC